MLTNEEKELIIKILRSETRRIDFVSRYSNKDYELMLSIFEKCRG